MFLGAALVSSRPWTGSQSGEERGPVRARSSASASTASKQRRMYFALIRTRSGGPDHGLHPDGTMPASEGNSVPVSGATCMRRWVKGGPTVSTSNIGILEDGRIGVRLKIAALWIAMLFLFAYGDIFGFFNTGRIEEVIAG